MYTGTRYCIYAYVDRETGQVWIGASVVGITPMLLPGYFMSVCAVCVCVYSSISVIGANINNNNRNNISDPEPASNGVPGCCSLSIRLGINRYCGWDGQSWPANAHRTIVLWPTWSKRTRVLRPFYAHTIICTNTLQKSICVSWTSDAFLTVQIDRVFTGIAVYRKR